MTITTGTNELTFYYTKRTDLSYTVKYLEQGTNNVLSTDKVVNGQTFGATVNESAISINGYNAVAPITGSLTITTGTNELTFYYKAAEQTYIINHYLIGTTEMVSPSETKTALYSATINGKNEKKDNLIGYVYNYSDPESFIVSYNNEENVINIYYSIVSGTVKVRYVDINNNELLTSEILTGRVGTEYNTILKEIAKYKFLRVEGNETGEFVDGELVITYVYEPVPNTSIYMNEVSVIAPIISMTTLGILIILKKKICNN